MTANPRSRSLPGATIRRLSRRLADESRVAARFALDRREVFGSLEDSEAFGWVQRSLFAGMGRWSLTGAGRAQDCAQLAAELDAAGAQPGQTWSPASSLPDR